MRTVTIIGLLLLLGLLVDCSGGGGGVGRVLGVADTLMFRAPDSAVALLDSLDLVSASRAERARHALLLTKAREKADSVITDDSLITVATEYYRGRGDSLETQSLFYRGVILAHSGDHSNALLSLMQASDLARATGDDFYLAMAYREQADICYNFSAHNFRHILSNRSAYHFDLAHKPVHAAWERIGEAFSLVKVKSASKAVSLLDSISQDIYDLDQPALLSEMLNTYAYACYQEHQYEKTISSLNRNLQSGHELQTFDYYIGCLAYRAMGQTDSSLIWRNELDRRLYCKSDSLASLHLSRLFKEDSLLTGDALLAIKDYDSIKNTVIDTLIANPIASILEDHYVQQTFADKRKLDNKISGLNKIITISLCIMICIISLIYFMYKFFTKEKSRLIIKAESLRRDKESLDKEFESLAYKKILLEKEFSSLEKDFKTLEKQNQNLASEKSINENLFDKLECWNKAFDRICAEIYCIPTPKKQKITNLLANQSNYALIETFVNKGHDDIMSRFRNSFPELDEIDYKIMLLLFAGYSRDAICFIIEAKSTNSYAVRKHRLKKQIINNHTVETKEFTAYF